MIAGEFPHELKQRVRGLRVAGQSVGPAGRAARRLGARPRRARRAHGRRPGRASTTSSTSARRCRSIRAARSIARAFVRDPAAGPACASASSARAKARPASASAGSATRCCSSSSRRALVATLGEVGVTRIVTCDPHALNSLRNEYPELGGHYEVLHHTQLIAELLADGRIDVDASAERIDLPRPLLPRAAQRRVRCAARDPRAPRRRRRRSSSRCRARRRCAAAPAAAACGSTRRSARASTSLRVEQALETSPQTIATACPYCAVMMERRPGGAARRGRDAVARHRRAGRGRARRRSAGRAGIARGDGSPRRLKRAPAPTCPRARCAADRRGGSGGSPDRRRSPRARCDRGRAR